MLQVICHWVSYLDVSVNCISAPHSQLKLPASYPSFTVGHKAPTSPSEGCSKGMAMFLNRKERLSDDATGDDDSKSVSGDRCSTPYSDLLGIIPSIGIACFSESNAPGHTFLRCCSSN